GPSINGKINLEPSPRPSPRGRGSLIQAPNNIEETKMGLARDLAEFFAKTRLEDLPPTAVEHSKMLIASTLASAAAGFSISSTEAIRGLAEEDGGEPTSTVWFDGGTKLPLPAAARANAVASDASA